MPKKKLTSSSNATSATPCVSAPAYASSWQRRKARAKLRRLNSEPAQALAPARALPIKTAA